MTILGKNEVKPPVDRLVAMNALELAIRAGTAEPSHYTAFCESKRSEYETSDFVLSKLLRMYDRAKEQVEDRIRLIPLMLERLVLADPNHDGEEYIGAEYADAFKNLQRKLQANLNKLNDNQVIEILKELVAYPNASRPVTKVLQEALNYYEVQEMYYQSQSAFSRDLKIA